MTGMDLVFRILGLNEASKVMTEVQASAAETAVRVRESDAAMARSAEETAAKRDESMAASTSKLNTAGPVMLGVAAAAVVLGAKTVEMGQKFETGMLSLQTGAGESAKNIGMVSAGVLKIAPELGTSTEKLTKGMFMIESAGFHGADGLKVLTSAAEGAKVGNAELSTVGNALTDVLNDYHLPASAAVAVTSQLVKTVSLGKTSMEELGTSMSAVVPLASAAHIGFDQVAGAMATMTGHGMSAQQSAQDLAATITSLQAPNAVAVKEMMALGLNSNQVSMDLGKQGLTGTMTELTTAITSHMGRAGTVLQNSFESSSAAAANAKQMIESMPPALGKMATAMLNGSLTSKQWGADIKGLDPISKHTMQQFAETAKQTHSFNSLLTSGGPAAQTYNAALEKMTGGSTGLATSLLLTGENAEQFAGNVKAAGDAGKTTAAHVTGWSQVTGTLQFKLDAAKEVTETLGIKIGLVLMPVVKAMVGGFTEGAKVIEEGVTWMTKHKTIAEALGIGIAVVLVPALWATASALVATAAGAIATAAPFAAVILIVAGLAYGIMELVKHWGTVEHVFTVGFDFVKDHWKIFVSAFLPGIGLLIVGVTELVKHWGAVEHFFDEVFSAIGKAFMVTFVNPIEDGWRFLVRITDAQVRMVTGFFTKDLPAGWRMAKGLFDTVFVNPIMGAVHAVEHGFTSTFGAIPHFVSGAFSALVGDVRRPVNGVIGLVDEAIGYIDGLHVSIPSWVPGVGGETFGVNIPKIPQLARGGLVMPREGGTTVTVAEAGQPEIVTPIPAMQQAMTAALAAGHPGGGGRGGAGSSADQPLYAELHLKLDGQTIDKILVKFQNQGGRLQSVAMAVA